MTASERVKFTIKVVISHILYALGLLQLWQSITLKRRAVILMYHRVLTLEERARSGSHPAIMVDRETFAEQMAVVKRRFKVLSLEEFADRMSRKIPFDDSSCLITFDDGWMDNFTNALPILRKYELPAVVFLPVNFIGRNRLFWQEALVHLLVLAVMTARKDPARETRLRDLIDPIGLGEIFDVCHDDPRPHVVEATSKNRKGLTPSVVEATLTNLRIELRVENGDSTGIDSFMNWEQVDTMSRQGIEFGGHGAEHRLLSQMPIAEAREDIQLSKEVIDLRLKCGTPTFSYPRGYWNPEVAGLVRESGFRLAFLAQGRSVSCDDNPFALQRINICQAATESMPMFLARVVGLF
jgi:peptidoglycan/xylan/chitin deacetylase (PgdA/CDA1 family)